jgi:outer membrane immunogenic protein
MTWTGAYVGVHGGYAKSDADWSYTNINPYSAPGPDGPITASGVSFSPDGFNLGGKLGANYQLGQLVMGAEASFAGMNLESTPTNPGQFLPPGEQSVATDVENLLLVTGRLGWAWEPRWLGYVKGGYARAEVATRGSLQPPDPGATSRPVQAH